MDEELQDVEDYAVGYALVYVYASVCKRHFIWKVRIKDSQGLGCLLFVCMVTVGVDEFSHAPSNPGLVK